MRLSQVAAELDHVNRPELSNPATRSVELFANDLQLYGSVRPEISRAVIDEELTNAAEDIAYTMSKYAVVPRTYYQRGEDLEDIYQNSLTEVFQDGIDWCNEELHAGKPGAAWELERRRADQANLKMIIGMPPGSICVETSSTALDKPENERLAQGYNGMTHIRASAKDISNVVNQYNFMVPSSEPTFLLSLQRLQGVPENDQTTNSLKLLESPVISSDGGDEAAAIRELENLIGAALLESRPDQAVLNMLKKSVSARRESWTFVSSEEHAELHQELQYKITELAYVHPNWWQNGMDSIRSGFLKELRQRYVGEIHDAKYGSVIQAAAARAVVDGDVFITCGSTINASELSSNTPTGTRGLIADKLRKEVNGSGACGACGAKGKLYGCGIFCKSCNEVWCDRYENTGEQLSEEQIRYLRHAKPYNSGQKINKPGILEELSRHWQDISVQVREKRQTKLRAERLKRQAHPENV